MSWQYWVAGYVLFCTLVMLFFAANACVSEQYDRMPEQYDEPEL